VTKTQELIAELQLGLNLLLQRLPLTEKQLREQVQRVQTEALKFPARMDQLFVELASLSYGVLGKEELKDLHQKAAHFLDLRLQLIFSQLHHEIESHLQELDSRLAMAVPEIPLQKELVAKSRQALIALNQQLKRGITNKADEDTVVGLVLYLSQQMRLFFDQIPVAKERLRTPLAQRWNTLITLCGRYLKFSRQKLVGQEMRLPSGASIRLIEASP
jgi:hypothetical protein